MGASVRLLRAVLMGPPGSGKRTVALRITKGFQLKTFSSGDLLRDNLREKGVLETFSGTKTDQIWPCVRAFLQTKVPQIDQKASVTP